MTTHSNATHGTHGHSPQAHALATDSPALSFDPSAWMIDVNCKSVGPDDAWTEVPFHHPTLHSIIHSPSVTTVKTSNLLLPLYSLIVTMKMRIPPSLPLCCCCAPMKSPNLIHHTPSPAISFPRNSRKLRKSPCQNPPKPPPPPLQAPNQPAHTPSMGSTSRNALCLP